MSKSKGNFRNSYACSLIGSVFKKKSVLPQLIPSSVAGKRVVFLTVAFGLLLATVITGIEVFSSYRNSVLKVQQIHRNIETVFSDLFKQYPGIMNGGSSKALVEGMASLEAIDRAVLQWDGKEPIKAGKEPSADDIHSFTNLIRATDGSPKISGSLHFYSSRVPLQQSLFFQFWWLLLANMLNSILVACFALYLFSRLYAVHVLHIAKYARNFEVERKIRPLQLIRSEKTVRQGDELQELVDSLNLVGVRVRTAHRLIADQNKQLAQLLDERSRSLDVANKRLLERSRLATIGAVVAMVAHELRNPLGAIKASLVMAKKHQQIPTEDTERALNRIGNCVLRCDNTIENLRMLSRRKKLLFQKIELGLWIEEQLRSQEIDMRLVTVRTELQKKVYVAMDNLTISQVFYNLIENSIQAINPENLAHGGDIFIRLYKHGHSACIEIIDTGEGIPVKDIARVFDPLYTTKPSGYGLGLSFSLNLVEEHGGTLTLKPLKSASGAIATIVLPLLEESTKINRPTDIQREPESALSR